MRFWSHLQSYTWDFQGNFRIELEIFNPTWSDLLPTLNLTDIARDAKISSDNSSAQTRDDRLLPTSQTWDDLRRGHRKTWDVLFVRLNPRIVMVSFRQFLDSNVNFSDLLSSIKMIKFQTCDVSLRLSSSSPFCPPWRFSSIIQSARWCKSVAPLRLSDQI